MTRSSKRIAQIVLGTIESVIIIVPSFLGLVYPLSFGILFSTITPSLAYSLQTFAALAFAFGIMNAFYMYRCVFHEEYNEMKTFSLFLVPAYLLCAFLSFVCVMTIGSILMLVGFLAAFLLFIRFAYVFCVADLTQAPPVRTPSRKGCWPRYIQIFHGYIESLSGIIPGVIGFVYPEIYEGLFPVQDPSVKYALRLFSALNLVIGIMNFYYVQRGVVHGEYAQMKRFCIMLCIADAGYSAAAIAHVSALGPMMWVPAIMDIVLLASKVYLFVLGKADRWWEPRLLG